MFFLILSSLAREGFAALQLEVDRGMSSSRWLFRLYRVTLSFERDNSCYHGGTWIHKGGWSHLWLTNPTLLNENYKVWFSIVNQRKMCRHTAARYYMAWWDHWGNYHFAIPIKISLKEKRQIRPIILISPIFIFNRLDVWLQWHRHMTWMLYLMALAYTLTIFSMPSQIVH